MTTYNFTSSGLTSPSDFRRKLVTNAGVFISALTGAITTISRPGERWELDITWRNVSATPLRSLIAFFMKLNGPEHRVQFKEYGHTQRGTYGGTPLVKGASQTGRDLVCDAASNSITNWTRAGDFISFDNQARMVLADANSDGSGNVTIKIAPAIRTSPANNAAVNVVGTELGVFILTSPVEYLVAALNFTSGGEPIGNLSLSFVEDVSA